MVYLRTFTYHEHQLNVGKYTSPMDPMGEMMPIQKNAFSRNPSKFTHTFVLFVSAKTSNLMTPVNIGGLLISGGFPG